MAVTDFVVNFIGKDSGIKQNADAATKSFSDLAIKEQIAADKAAEFDKEIKRLAKSVRDGGISMEDAADEADRLGKELGQTEQQAGKTSKGFSDLAKVGLAIAFAKAGEVLLEFGKQAITAASDVQETQSKFNAVFKDLAGETTDELQTFADAANRSIFDLQGFAATLQDTFVPLGFARDEAASTSIQLVKLAEDLASFNNLNTADVINDLQSAMVGNTETLRKYGIVATQAAIDQEALALGLEFTKGRMDAQTKAAAILSITMKSTTDAQGDAIKTADGYANVSKGLEASLKDLSVAIGSNLLPAMTDLKKETTNVVSGFAGFIKGNNAINQAAADGIITQAEAARMIDKVALSSFTAADAQAELSKKYDEADRAAQSQLDSLSRLITEAESFDRVMTGNVGVMNDAAIAAFELTEEEQALADNIANNLALSRDNAMSNEELGISHEMVAEVEKRRIEIATELEVADKKLADEQQRLADISADLAVKSGDLFSKFQEGDSIIEASGSVLMELADSAGASAEQLALLGVASGKLTPAQAELRIKNAALTQSLQLLSQEFASGNLSAEEYMLAAQEATVEIENMTFATADANEETTNLGATAHQAADELRLESEHAETLTEALSDIPSVTQTVTIDGLDDALANALALSGALGGLDQGSRQAIESGEATERSGGVGLSSGANFEVPPGFPNDSFPMKVETGERVIVIPKNQQSTVNQNFTVNTSSIDLASESRAGIQFAQGGI